MNTTEAAAASGGGLPVDEAAAAAGLTVTRAGAGEWRTVVEWAAREGWNPGEGDLGPFHAADPRGFFLGRVGGEPATAVSVVRYDDDYAFLGFYLVRPDLRGAGLGLATWRAALPHAGAATVGLDGVPAQVDTYRRSGFTTAHRTLRHSGVVRHASVPSAQGVVPVTADLLDAVAAYDRACFPADRGGFVRRWLTAPGRSAFARLSADAVTGYGVIRPGRSGYRVGPLFADDAAGAAALLDALAATAPAGAQVHLDIPEPAGAAAELAASRGLVPVSHTTRMYTGPVPAHRAAATWAVTSLELG